MSNVTETTIKPAEVVTQEEWTEFEKLGEKAGKAILKADERAYETRKHEFKSMIEAVGTIAQAEAVCKGFKHAYGDSVTADVRTSELRAVLLCCVQSDEDKAMMLQTITSGYHGWVTQARVINNKRLEEKATAEGKGGDTTKRQRGAPKRLTEQGLENIEEKIKVAKPEQLVEILASSVEACEKVGDESILVNSAKEIFGHITDPFSLMALAEDIVELVKAQAESQEVRDAAEAMGTIVSNLLDSHAAAVSQHH